MSGRNTRGRNSSPLKGGREMIKNQNDQNDQFIDR